MSTQNKLPVWLLPVIVITALLSLFSVYRRHQVEASNKAVSMAAEYETVESLAGAQGLSVDVALENLKAQGLNAVVLSEDTIGQLVSEGRAVLIGMTTPVGSVSTAIKFNDVTQMPRVLRGLQIRFGQAAVVTRRRGDMLLLPDYSALALRSTAIGLSPTVSATVRKAGLGIIARCSNPTGVNDAAVRATLEWAHSLGAIALLPQGDQVIGRRDAIETTAKTLQALGMVYATAEFAKIGGDSNIVGEIPESVIRLHSAQVAELDKLTLPDVIERYSKAAREREMRYLLIRPASYGSEKPLATYAALVKAIGSQIRAEGGDLGVARPFHEPNLPRPIFPLIGLGVAAVAFFVGSSFITDRRVRIAGGVIVGLLGLAAWNHTGAKLDALIAAIVFPVAGFLVLNAWRPKNPFAGFAATTFISLTGGLAIAGLLNGLRYYVVADEFLGVKFAVFIPLVIVGFLFFRELTDWRKNLRSPITWGMSALTIALAAVFALMIARTGNDTGAGASGLELQFRSLLDNALFVRPRTKEFMVGHPILFVAIAMLSRYGRQKGTMAGWTAVVLMVGAVGQTSVVNTLCHFHVPVVLSLMRIGIGAVLGCMIGFALWMAIGRFLPTPQVETTSAD